MTGTVIQQSTSAAQVFAILAIVLFAIVTGLSWRTFHYVVLIAFLAIVSLSISVLFLT